MPGSFMRRVYDSLMPQGSAWEPEFGGYMDRFLDGCADNTQKVYDDLEKLAFIRNPLLCPIDLLPDLEMEYGISANNSIPEETRRNQIYVKRSIRQLSLVYRLQTALHKMGYMLTVTPNGSPASSPDDIIGERGYYLVNGDMFNSTPNYPQAGFMWSEDYPSKSSAGYYENYAGYDNEYSAGTDSNFWPFVFFIGGAVTRNENGSIAAVDRAVFPIKERFNLHSLILKIKPLFSWAGMCVEYQ